MATIWCIGRNYAAHAAELGNEVPSEPVVFLKAESCLRGLTPSPVAFADESFHHELELVVHVAHPVPLGGDPGWAAVGAVSLGIDLTRRAVQADCKARGLPWTTSKSFAGSAIVAPAVALDALGPRERLVFRLLVDGELRQQGALADALFDVPTLLRHLARHAPLQPGDLVYTGTPSGVGPIRVGQRFELVLEAAETHRWSGML